METVSCLIQKNPPQPVSLFSSNSHSESEWTCACTDSTKTQFSFFTEPESKGYMWGKGRKGQRWGGEKQRNYLKQTVN